MRKPPINFPNNFINRGGMRFRLVRAGSFTMGDPGPFMERNESIGAHEVFVSCPFYLAETPVTRGQWKSLMGTTPWDEDGPDTNTPDHPATHVSQAAAVKFCDRMSAKGKLSYRLPTEAEWEYACRAGTRSKYYFGDNEKQLADYGWFKDNSDGDTHPVATKMPNAWGLHDMHGLVLEWCCDDWSYRQSDQAIDPVVFNGDLRKVVKGGSWIAKDYKCVPHYRYGIHGGWRLAHVGFRPVLQAMSVEKMLRRRLARNRMAAVPAS